MSNLFIAILYAIMILCNGGETHPVVGVVDDFQYIESMDVFRTDVKLENGEKVLLYDYVANRGSKVIIEFYNDDTPKSYEDNGIKSVTNVVENHYFGLY